MATLLNALGPMLSSMGSLMTNLSLVLLGTGQMLSLNVADFRSGAWMLQTMPDAMKTTQVNDAVAFMGGNMTMATAAFTVVSKPLVELGGPMVGNLGSIVATLPDVLKAMTSFFSTLVDFLKA